jgi:hypothetical protein
MQIAPESLRDAAADIAKHYPSGRFTATELERTWRIGRHYSFGLASLARERCERLCQRGLLDRVPGPRGGAGYAFNASARERWPELF